MTKQKYLALTLAALLTMPLATAPAAWAEDSTGAATSSPQAPDQTNPKGDRKPPRMMKSDTNQDGFLTKDELSNAHKERLDTMFKKTDTNSDGKLSRDEMKVAREKRRAERQEKMKEWRAKKGAGHEGHMEKDGMPEPVDQGVQ